MLIDFKCLKTGLAIKIRDDFVEAVIDSKSADGEVYQTVYLSKPMHIPQHGENPTSIFSAKIS